MNENDLTSLEGASVAPKRRTGTGLLDSVTVRYEVQYSYQARDQVLHGSYHSSSYVDPSRQPEFASPVEVGACLPSSVIGDPKRPSKHRFANELEHVRILSDEGKDLG